VTTPDSVAVLDVRVLRVDAWIDDGREAISDIDALADGIPEDCRGDTIELETIADGDDGGALLDDRMEEIGGTLAGLLDDAARLTTELLGVLFDESAEEPGGTELDAAGIELDF